jgi:hypothetical protein
MAIPFCERFQSGYWATSEVYWTPGVFSDPKEFWHLIRGALSVLDEMAREKLGLNPTDAELRMWDDNLLKLRYGQEPPPHPYDTLKPLPEPIWTNICPDGDGLRFTRVYGGVLKQEAMAA